MRDTIEYEHGLIAAVIVNGCDRNHNPGEPDLMAEIRGHTLAPYFTDPVRSLIWRVMCEQHRAGGKLDLVGVYDACCAAGVKLDGVPLRGSTLAEWMHGFLDLDERGYPHLAQFYARKLVEHGIRRERDHLAADLRSALHNDGRDLTEFYPEHLRLLSEPIEEASGEDGMGAAMVELATRIDSLPELAAEQNTALTTGIVGLDRILGGYRDGHLIIVGGRPGHGKSALAITSTLHLIRRGIGVGYVSVEMPREEVAERLAAQLSGVDLIRFFRGPMSSGEKIRALDAAARIASMPLHVTDRAHRWPDAVNECRRMVAMGARVLFLDYLHLFSVPGADDDRSALTTITREAKQLALTMHVPIVLLAQVNREGDDDARPPSLKHLKGSGSIEEDANVVIFVHRPDIRNKQGKRSEATFIVAKHRGGPVGDVPGYFNAPVAQYADVANFEEGQS